MSWNVRCCRSNRRSSLPESRNRPSRRPRRIRIGRSRAVLVHNYEVERENEFSTPSPTSFPSLDSPDARLSRRLAKVKYVRRGQLPTPTTDSSVFIRGLFPAPLPGFVARVSAPGIKGDAGQSRSKASTRRTTKGTKGTKNEETIRESWPRLRCSAVGFIRVHLRPSAVPTDSVS